MTRLDFYGGSEGGGELHKSFRRVRVGPSQGTSLPNINLFRRGGGEPHGREKSKKRPKGKGLMQSVARPGGIACTRKGG